MRNSPEAEHFKDNIQPEVDPVSPEQRRLRELLAERESLSNVLDYLTEKK